VIVVERPFDIHQPAYPHEWLLGTPPWGHSPSHVPFPPSPWRPGVSQADERALEAAAERAAESDLITDPEERAHYAELLKHTK
jgi:hypothetical protein